MTTTYKVADLIGWRLDLAVALAEGATRWTFSDARGVFAAFDDDVHEEEIGRRVERTVHLTGYRPSTDWFDGGPIIERECLTLDRDSNPKFQGSPWMAIAGRHIERGATPLVAAMRASLRNRVGDTVELPA